MKKNLFIVCPFSMMETFLQSHVDGESLFLTVPGAMPDLEDPFTVETIRNLAASGGLQNLYVVNDSSCRFIADAVKGRETPGSAVGLKLLETLRLTGLERTDNLPEAEFAMRLAEYNVRRQLKRLAACADLQKGLADGGVRVKGLVTCRERGIIMDLNTSIRNRVLHEH